MRRRGEERRGEERKFVFLGKFFILLGEFFLLMGEFLFLLGNLFSFGEFYFLLLLIGEAFLPNWKILLIEEGVWREHPGLILAPGETRGDTIYCIFSCRDPSTPCNRTASLA
jgi:hypothetical protein